MDDKSSIVFNINGGNNQILPNATQATQNFYGDKYIEEMAKKENADKGCYITKSPSAHYINIMWSDLATMSANSLPARKPAPWLKSL